MVAFSSAEVVLEPRRTSIMRASSSRSSHSSKASYSESHSATSASVAISTSGCGSSPRSAQRMGEERVARHRRTDEPAQAGIVE